MSVQSCTSKVFTVRASMQQESLHRDALAVALQYSSFHQQIPHPAHYIELQAGYATLLQGLTTFEVLDVA